MAADFSLLLKAESSHALIPIISDWLQSRPVHKMIEELRRENLARLRQEVGGLKPLAELLDKDESQVSQWIQGSKNSSTGKPRGMRSETARYIEERTKKPPGWLDLSHENAQPFTLTHADVDHISGIDRLSVPALSNAASMGAGLDQLPEDVVVGRLTLSPSWVAKNLRPLSAPSNLRFVHGYGDSMEPTFLDGDILLVDAGVRECRVDGIYVLSANERLYIKRVRQRLDGSYEISSDNPNVKTVDVLDGSRPVDVLGRVIWAWNGRKL